MNSGEEPILKESEKPTGAWNWQPPENANLNLAEEITVYMEGRG
jgi:hypothetical protein